MAAAGWYPQLITEEREGLKSYSGLSRDRLVIQPVFSSRKVFLKSATVPITSNLAIRAWNIKCRWKKKLIVQFGWKLRDERFEPN